MLKYLIFDVDGTLILSQDLHAKAFMQALKDIIDYRMPRKVHKDQYCGLSTKQKLNKLCMKGIIKAEDIDKIAIKKQEYTFKLIEEEVKFDREIYTTIKLLKENGFNLGIYTNCIRKTTDTILEKLGIIDFFDIILCNEDVKEPKPSPEGYNKIIKHFGVNPLDVVILEDSKTGIESAKGSGANVFIVCGPTCVNYSNIMHFISEIDKR